MTKTKKKDPRWTPVRSGARYCSPGCGAGCTFDAYQRANREAEKLVKRLGPSCKPRVWENFGWRYGAVGQDGYLKVYPAGAGKFYAMLGRVGGRWISDHYEDPARAVSEVIQKARKEQGEIQKMIEDAEMAMGTSFDRYFARQMTKPSFAKAYISAKADIDRRSTRVRKTKS